MGSFRVPAASREEAINRKRAEELIKAAEQEEENLYNIQAQIGQELAAKNDFSVLGKLYGLTQDQIDRMQGTGKYKKKSSTPGRRVYDLEADRKEQQDMMDFIVAGNKAGQNAINKELAKKKAQK